MTRSLFCVVVILVGFIGASNSSENQLSKGPPDKRLAPAEESAEAKSNYLKLTDALRRCDEFLKRIEEERIRQDKEFKRAKLMFEISKKELELDLLKQELRELENKK